MGLIDYLLASGGLAIVLGAYVWTFFVQKDGSDKRKELHDKIDNLDRAWVRTADAMRVSRDDQVGRMKGEISAALSDVNVRLADFRLHTATHYATTESVERMRGEMMARFDKTDGKIDNILTFVKAGRQP